MSTPLTSIKPIDNTATGSYLHDGALLGSGTTAAVLWSDAGRTAFYLTLVGRGGTVGSPIALGDIAGASPDAQAYIAAVGTDRIAVVVDNKTAAPAMYLYDNTGDLLTEDTSFSAGVKQLSVVGLADNSFIVKWTDASGYPYYTHYTASGSKMAGEIATPLAYLVVEHDTAPVSIVGDASGGYMYSSGLRADIPGISALHYVGSNGIESGGVLVDGASGGALAFDGTSFWYFYNDLSGKMFMQQASSTALVGPAIPINFTTTNTPIAKSLGSGLFLLEDHDKVHAAIVNTSGAIVDSYQVTDPDLDGDGVPDQGIFGVAIPTPDHGVLWVENLPPSGDPGQQWDITIGALDSVFLEPPPTVTISTDHDTLKAGQQATITFAFSQKPVGFVPTDIGVTGGSITGLVQDPADPTRYTATFIPTASDSLDASISVAAGKFTNAVNLGNADNSNVVHISGDTLAPDVVAIARSAPASQVTNADTLVFHVTFSDAVANLDVTDFTVSGTTASVTAITSAGGNAYDVTVTGGDLASYNGPVSLGISSSNDLADAGGNALGSTTPGLAQGYTLDNLVAAPILTLPADTGADTNDGITNNTTFTVTFASDVAGWEYSTDSGAHWTAGSGTSFTLSDGEYAAGAIQVRQTDGTGNISTASSNPYFIHIDTTVDTPSFVLAHDTGNSASDGITADGTVNVSLAAEADSWEYSVDGGANWTNGNGSSFTLAEGQYAAGAVQVRQADVAGNVSTASSNGTEIQVLAMAAAPTFALANDSGSSGSDGITRDGTVNVTLPADIASWEYSIDGGANWAAGTDHGFTLAPGGYAGGDIRVRYFDTAGNPSAAASNAAVINIDDTAGAASLALQSDNGENPTDGTTNDPRISVTLPGDVASWEYSVDGGAHWNAGSGARFNLAEGHYAPGQVQVRYTDIAGNGSTAASNSAAYTILAAPSPKPEPAPVIIDGVQIQTGTVRNPDGSTTNVITVPVITPDRVDSAGNSTVADIPLATSGGASVLTAQLPVGYGLQVAGAITPQSAQDSLAELIRQIQSHSGAGSDQDGLLAAGAGFLDQLGGNTRVLVQSIAPTLAAGPGNNGPLVLSGATHTDGAPATALVIDASGLPADTTIELQNVDFAALIGSVRVTGGDGSQKVFGDGASQYIVLGADDDVLHGGGGDDIVGSEGGNDMIYGDEGNDIVFGGIGNDYVDGGSGNDTVVLQGASRADYSLGFDHGNLVATHLGGGADGVDTIANVENLRFAGAKADMGAESTLRRVYDTLFDRAADQAGSAYWSDANAHGMSMHDIAATMLGAGEAGGTAALSNAAFVDKLYQYALGGQVVPVNDRANWIGQLDQGKADRADVVLGIANSNQKLALDAQEHSDLAFAMTDAAGVLRLYQTVFGRLADEAGVNYWIGQSESGMAIRDITTALLQSGEGQQHYGGSSDTDFVEALYQMGLGRASSTAETQYWAGLLHDGALTRADVVLFFANSPEQIGLVGTSTTILGM